MAEGRRRGESRCARGDRPRRGPARSRGLLRALLGSTFLIAAASAAQAQDATWLAAPGSNNFNTGTNWDTGTTPGSGATAFFGPSNTTSVTLTTTAVGGITLNAGAANYTFGVASGTATVDGAGFVVNGGTATLNIDTGATRLIFSNNSSAGTIAINNNSSQTGAGGLNFLHFSTAANATITTASGSITLFDNHSTAGNATITTQNGAGTSFTGSAAGGTSRHIIDAGGAVDIATVASGTITLGSIEGAGTMHIGPNILTIGSNNLSTTFSGALTGSIGRFIKDGTGTLTLSGSSSTYGGDTTINGGTLAVNGSLTNSSGIIVNNTGTLGGTGAVPTVTVNNGGALAPGNSIGTINVNGNVTFNAGSTYNVEVSPSAADKTVATGTASLTGGTVQATFQAGSYLTKHYTILTSAGLGGTTFSGLNTISLPTGFTAVLSYTLTDAILYLTADLGALPTAGLSGSQQGVANTLNNFFNNGGALPPGFVTLFGLSDHALTNGLSQASGQPGPSSAQSGITATSQFMTTVFDNAFDQGGASGDSGAPLGYAAERKVSRQSAEAYAAVMPRDRAADFDNRWRVWATAYGGASRVSGDSSAGTATTSSRVYGVIAGADMRADAETRLGFALGGAGTSFAIDGGLGSGRTNMFNASIYGKRQWGPAYVAAALGYAWQDASTDRTVTIAGTDVLHASFHPQALTGRLETGRRYVMPAFGVTPYAALQTTTFFMPSYSESATSGSNQFALSYASKIITATRGELGARIDKAYAVQGGVFTLKATTAWAHDWNTDRAATATFQALPGTSFTVNGARPSADAALLSLGGEMDWGTGWRVAANVDGEFARGSQSYAAKGALKRAW